MQHYFINENLTNNQRVILPLEIGHHLSKVLRAEVGDKFQLVSVTHLVYLAEIGSIDGRQVTATIQKELHMNVELPVEVTIVSGLSKKNKPELIVQKATELGADHIIFLPMARSIVKWDQKSEKKLKRLNEVALSAAEQSHRNLVPTVSYLHSLYELTKRPFDVKLVAYEEAAKDGEESHLAQALKDIRPDTSIVAVFGPEGGISSEEISLLTDQAYISAGLGPRILRTETAPMYFLSSVSVMTELLKS
ncbi:MAG: 16S rRNA (uracil(1498)-N(3))-methyltransferase [Lentilactobacillus buchneri]|jgi:16S rRNA (uracil1498-N3)-methyltransferase|nr:16S rRNA (uracil(1498)-N(3))-methyltransferase [Lentilactobacillus buchneri]MCI1950489.1 16S rRNA (uracil(1498)-N(3))-methyltransferase [Lentilactobacillus buchneri]MCI2019265.1 16S rRNA (uracil(1498)-N(3))-methyltransferase [Lentilactobacillus buchneri]MCI2027551.1 16S rRNA (uracil(1498)-N(3))-methyltransferase [Lentilactobacillus buchneri]